jgi:hypothetical protein
MTPATAAQAAVIARTASLAGRARRIVPAILAGLASTRAISENKASRPVVRPGLLASPDALASPRP